MLEKKPDFEIADFIKNRTSCRRFDNSKKITDDQLNSVLEAGRWAPSGTNFQPWTFIVIKDKEKIEKIGDMFKEGGPFTKFVKYAPMLIGVVIDNSRSRVSFFDGTCAAMNMSYEIEHQGLRSCMVACVFFESGQFRHKTKDKFLYNILTMGRYKFLRDIKDMLGLPRKKELILLIALGYEDETYKPNPEYIKMSTKRNPLEKLVYYDTYKTNEETKED